MMWALVVTMTLGVTPAVSWHNNQSVCENLAELAKSAGAAEATCHGFDARLLMPVELKPQVTVRR